MEWGEVGVAALPARFAHRVDDKWYYNDDKAADNEYCNPSAWISCRDLCRRYKAQNKGEQGAAEAKTCDNPHCKVTTEAEWSLTVAHTVSENYCRSKEHHIHNKV